MESLELKNKTQQILQLIEENNKELLPEAVQEMPTIEVAEILQSIPIEQMEEVLLAFDVDLQGLLFSNFEEQVQHELFELLEIDVFAEIFMYMDSDVRADFYQMLESEDQIKLLPFLNKKVREDVIALSAYPPETAGGIMSTDFATIIDDMSVAQSLEKIRKDAPSRKMVYYVYVVDKQMKMKGFVTLKDLIMESPETSVSEVVRSDFIFALVNEDREIVAKKIEKYDLVAIPVLNKMMQLVGIISHDDALDVIRAEHTEDMEKFMGIVHSGDDSDYFQTGILQHFKKRAVWLIILAAVGIISGMIIHSFEATLEKLIILALYMPMMADTGGNSGSQAATVVIRSMALGQVSLKNWWRVLLKEFSISVLLSVCLALMAFAKILFLSYETTIPEAYSLTNIAIIISFALALQVITSTVIGAGLPLLVKTFKGDPAVVASPAITTVVDITGLLIYFWIATTFIL